MLKTVNKKVGARSAVLRELLRDFFDFDNDGRHSNPIFDDYLISLFFHGFIFIGWNPETQFLGLHTTMCGRAWLGALKKRGVE